MNKFSCSISLYSWERTKVPQWALLYGYVCLWRECLSVVQTCVLFANPTIGVLLCRTNGDFARQSLGHLKHVTSIRKSFANNVCGRRSEPTVLYETFLVGWIPALD